MFYSITEALLINCGTRKMLPEANKQQLDSWPFSSRVLVLETRVINEPEERPMMTLRNADQILHDFDLSTRSNH